MNRDSSQVKKYLNKFVIFTLLVNISQIVWYGFEESIDAHIFLNLFMLRSFVTINAFVYVSIQFFLIKAVIDKKLNTLYVIVFIILLLFFHFSIHTFLTNKNGIELVKRMFTNGPDGYIFYFFIYYNVFGIIVYLPELIGNYITRKDRLFARIRKNNSIGYQNRMFSQLYIDALHHLKTIQNPSKRESELILLSDFYRFIVYESDNDSIPISKSVHFGNLYIQLIGSVYPHIKFSGELRIPIQHFNTPAMSVLNSLQQVIDLLMNKNEIMCLSILNMKEDSKSHYKFGLHLDVKEKIFENIANQIETSELLSDVLESFDLSERVLYFKSKFIHSTFN